MSDHNSPRMLDEVLSLSGVYSRPFGQGSAIVVYPKWENRADYYKLADYRVSASVSAGGLVMVPR